MKKCYFRCPVHGPIPTDDIKTDSRLWVLACPHCDACLVDITKSWEETEEIKAFFYVAGLVLLGAFVVWAYSRLGTMFDLSLWFSARRS